MIRPAEIAEAFAEEWGKLWRPEEEEDIAELCRELGKINNGLPKITHTETASRVGPRHAQGAHI